MPDETPETLQGLLGITPEAAEAGNQQIDREHRGLKPEGGGEVTMQTNEVKKAVVLVLPASEADDVARLVAAALSLNGYRHNEPSVIDWPVGGSLVKRFHGSRSGRGGVELTDAGRHIAASGPTPADPLQGGEVSDGE